METRPEHLRRHPLADRMPAAEPLNKMNATYTI